jgi:anti-anti-sigma regulatory factor
MTQQVLIKGGTLTLVGEATIYNAKDLQEQLHAAVKKKRSVRTIDLSQITELDTAGLQLLLGLKGWAQRSERVLVFKEPSAAAREVLELLQVELPMVENEAAS